MLGRILIVAGQVFTLFLMMGVGFFCAKKKWIDSTGTSQMSFLLLHIVTPCIIIDSLQMENTPQLLEKMLWAALIMTSFYIVSILLGKLFFRGEPQGRQKVLRFSVIYSNTGFLGLPLVQAVLGEEAVIYATISVVIFNLFTWTHGAVMMGGREAMSIRKALVNPGTVALAIGLPLFLFSVSLPGFLGDGIHMMAQLNTPVAMVVIGALMASSSLKLSFTQGRLYLVSLLRLVVIPLFFLLVLWPLHLDYLLYASCVILCSSPVAGMTAIFSLKYGEDTVLASQGITLSTILSILTMPVFAAAAEFLAG